MKPKWTLLAVALLLAVAVALILAGRQDQPETARTPGTLVVTQDGKVTLVPQGGRQPAMTVVAGNPAAGTNTPASVPKAQP